MHIQDRDKDRDRDRHGNDRLGACADPDDEHRAERRFRQRVEHYFFIQALENLGIEPFIFRGKERSGRCVSLISPDGERTMVTFLGAALELSAAEVTPAIFEGYDCLYIEGYLVQDHELIAGAVRTAKACGLKVAIDLASFNVVGRREHQPL